MKQSCYNPINPFVSSSHLEPCTTSQAPNELAAKATIRSFCSLVVAQHPFVGIGLSPKRKSTVDFLYQAPLHLPSCFLPSLQTLLITKLYLQYSKFSFGFRFTPKADMCELLPWFSMRPRKEASRCLACE